MFEENESNDAKYIDDYGTFFYKLRNGSLPLEYDTNYSIDKINKSLNNKTRDLFCGLVSAIIANCVSNYINSFTSFIITLIVSFAILELLYLAVTELPSKIKKQFDDKTLPEVKAEKIQDLFFKKVLVQTTYVFSISKRCQELKDNPQKKELEKIYAMQGVYGIRRISVELGEIFYKKKEKDLSKYVDVLGKSNLLAVISMLEDCLNTFKKSYSDCVEEADENRLNVLKQKIGVKSSEEQ